MNILHIISSSGIYGAERVLLNLVTALKAREHSPYVICLKNDSKPEPLLHTELKNKGVASQVLSCRHKFDISIINSLKRFMKEQGIELIHSHGYKANLYGAIVSKLTRTPIVATIHGWTQENHRVRFYERVDKFVIRGMDHLIPVSPLLSEELRKIGCSEKKITFIPNAIDTDKFNPSAVDGNVRNIFGLQGAFVIGTVGRLSSEERA